MYQKITRGIAITVRPSYLEDQSSPEENYFVWAYNIVIENKGEQTVQLQSRHWKITDARGRVQEVQGPGVVGEQPVLGPGERFEYTSGTPLPTSSGFMVGTYKMVSHDGDSFDVAIPAFSLDSPHEARRVN
ncbi:Co2+/Mg2+ efflux protein ApaG [Ferrovibrio sp.]|uniref:Co2+/Mg2+ efflux protein ApaG n=1 Tax=Ferrovibrio sp. TaxID=1917215 RepID=UPI003D2AE850